MLLPSPGETAAAVHASSSRPLRVRALGDYIGIIYGNQAFRVLGCRVRGFRGLGFRVRGFRGLGFRV